jgi:uncharacterized phage-associated protein
MAVSFEYDFESAFAAITYLSAQTVPELTKYKICKLLFLADKYHLVRFGRPITGDKYCALPYGPVPSHTLNILNAAISGEGHGILGERARRLNNALELETQYEQPRFRSKVAVDRDHLSDSDLIALNEIVREYGSLGFEKLKAITHTMFEYKNAWDDRLQGTNKADMSFESFFEEDPNARAGARDLMIEDDHLRKAAVIG